MKIRKLPNLLFADEHGNIYEYEKLQALAFLPGKLVKPKSSDWIALPTESKLFYVPAFPAVGWNNETKTPEYLYSNPFEEKVQRCYAVSAFMPPGFVRTHLSHFGRDDFVAPLPLWAYAAVGILEGKYVATGFRIEENPHWDPSSFDDRDLLPRIYEFNRRFSNNRLVHHLSRCATDYHCFAAKNLFLERWEAPIPTSPTCNSSCLGCISKQPKESGFPASHERIAFIPTVAEIVEIIAPHLERAASAIASFGQGCEGEPLMQGDLLVESVQALRSITNRGTINLNTNGSKPQLVQKLAQAGLDSIRISMNSAQEKLYNTYYAPRDYGFADVKDSIKLSVKHGLFTMLNYLVFPGITDTHAELDAVSHLIEECGLNMVHVKNLNIDPDYYWHALKLPFAKQLGLKRFVEKLKERFPKLFIGYFNQTKEVHEALNAPRG